MYEYWLDPPVPIYIQFYMFNLTNPEEFLQGEKPSLSQSGPYTYRFEFFHTHTLLQTFTWSFIGLDKQNV